VFAVSLSHFLQRTRTITEAGDVRKFLLEKKRPVNTNLLFHTWQGINQVATRQISLY